MTAKLIFLLAFVNIAEKAYSAKLPFRVIDEWGDSKIVVSADADDHGNLFTVTSQLGKYKFRSKHSFGGAFVSGAMHNHFVWFFPLQEMGNQKAAYLSLDEKVAYIIDLEKILHKHKFIPCDLSRTECNKTFNFWNISEWSYSERKISIGCRLNPNENFSGLIFYDHTRRCVDVIALKSDPKNAEVTYVLGDPNLPMEKVLME